MRPLHRIAGASLCALLALDLAAGRAALADDPEAAGGVPVEATPTPEPPGFDAWAIDTAVITAVTWGATLAFNENIRDGVTSSSGSEWWDNISQAPEWNDGSDAVTNYVAHPLLGTTWFLAYRSRGHGLVASSLGLMFQSAWLEYVIEGPYNIPSVHDLVFTPLIGIPLGYGLDTLSVYLLKREERPLRWLGYVANPFHLLPTAKKHRWEVAVDPVRKSLAFSARF